MKKVLLVLLLFTACFYTNAQEKNRSLSFSLTEGVNIEGKLITQFSTYLDYELNNGLTINSWTGASFGHQEWLSSVTTINKGKKNFTLGTGIMFNSGINEQTFNQQNLYGVIRIKYKIKL
tara:strand:+ start:7841 stop:8200 length:360 start_codon:yes stop_codon:yes gene_type:complete